MNNYFIQCLLLVLLCVFAGAPVFGAEDTKTDSNKASQGPRMNLQETHPEANDLCARVMNQLLQREVEGYCYINEVGAKGEHLEQFVLLSNAPQGQQFAAAAALSAMVTFMIQHPQIEGKSFVRMRSQAGEVRLLLQVNEALLCVEKNSDLDALSRCLLAHTQHH